MDIHLSLSADVEEVLLAAAERSGEAPDELARKALLAYLEDLEDYAAAIEAEREFDPDDTVPLSELLKRYDVEG